MSVSVPVSALGSPSERRQVCGKGARSTGEDFPISAHVHGGPSSYSPGGAPGIWYLDLTNTTRHACEDIHPVVVLVDRERTLTTSQVTLEAREDKGWRSLSLEKTDHDEIVGVLDDGSPGFAVPPGRTVTVRVRLAFARGTPRNEVVATAATVQRRGDDGEWVGESGTYRFGVGRSGPGGRYADDTEHADGYDRPERYGGGAGDPGRGGHAGRESHAGHSGDAGDTVDLDYADPVPAVRPERHRPGGGSSAVFVLAGSAVSGDLLGRAVAALALVTAGAVLAAGMLRLRTGRT
ncbi:hypothetical protein [Streptomyces sp. NPDC095613]|uniref:hypothetical protein n=1 Tax=Streptomyces sp. NPDC095613 TaxID=3155540 RepID=UPI00332683B0